MAPAFVAKLHNMLSCFLVVVVVDGGSEQQGKQQCMLWEGREEGANEVGFHAYNKLFRTTAATP